MGDENEYADPDAVIAPQLKKKKYTHIQHNNEKSCTAWYLPKVKSIFAVNVMLLNKWLVNMPRTCLTCNMICIAKWDPPPHTSAEVHSCHWRTELEKALTTLTFEWCRSGRVFCNQNTKCYHAALSNGTRHLTVLLGLPLILTKIVQNRRFGEVLVTLSWGRGR